jgi:hypothetical protein
MEWTFDRYFRPMVTRNRDGSVQLRYKAADEFKSKTRGPVHIHILGYPDTVIPDGDADMVRLPDYLDTQVPVFPSPECMLESIGKDLVYYKGTGNRLVDWHVDILHIDLALDLGARTPIDTCQIGHLVPDLASHIDLIKLFALVQTRMDLCHGLDLHHHVGQDAVCYTVRCAHPGHIQKAGYYLEVIFDPVVDLPDQGLLFQEGSDEFFLCAPPVSDIPVTPPYQNFHAQGTGKDPVPVRGILRDPLPAAVKILLRPGHPRS